jgi:hypothetical protein
MVAWKLRVFGDALDKLIKLDLLRENDQGLEAIDINTALLRLDNRWDDYFDFSGALS